LPRLPPPFRYADSFSRRHGLRLFFFIGAFADATPHILLSLFSLIRLLLTFRATPPPLRRGADGAATPSRRRLFS
jgi:hypothetical protein